MSHDALTTAILHERRACVVADKALAPECKITLCGTLCKQSASFGLRNVTR